MVTGLSNAYTHYITTHEEYQKQRYEAASTIFGPHTLRAYLEQYAYLTEKMLNVRYHQSYIFPSTIKTQMNLVILLFLGKQPISGEY